MARTCPSLQLAQFFLVFCLAYGRVQVNLTSVTAVSLQTATCSSAFVRTEKDPVLSSIDLRRTFDDPSFLARISEKSPVTRRDGLEKTLAVRGVWQQRGLKSHVDICLFDTIFLDTRYEVITCQYVFKKDFSEKRGEAFVQSNSAFKIEWAVQRVPGMEHIFVQFSFGQETLDFEWTPNTTESMQFYRSTADGDDTLYLWRIHAQVLVLMIVSSRELDFSTCMDKCQCQVKISGSIFRCTILLTRSENQESHESHWQGWQTVVICVVSIAAVGVVVVMVVMAILRRSRVRGGTTADNISNEAQEEKKDPEASRMSSDDIDIDMKEPIEAAKMLRHGVLEDAV